MVGWGYGLPQPVTSVTGFAMTGYKKCGGRWHTWVPPYKVFVGQGPCALPGEQGKNPPPFRQGRQQLFGGAVGRTEASAPTEVYLAVRRGGALPLPRATARVAPTEGLQGVRCGEESPSHGFAVPAPFRQGGQGDGGCRLPRALCALALTVFLQGAGARPAGGQGRSPLRDHFGFIYIGKFIFPRQKRKIHEYIV